MKKTANRRRDNSQSARRNFFITQRAADAHMANKLEFPGGKK